MNKKIIWITALITLLAYVGYTVAYNLQGTYNITIPDETYEYYNQILERRNLTWNQAINFILRQQIVREHESDIDNRIEEQYMELLNSGNNTKIYQGFLALRYINNH